jgi:hypothetical protein
MDTKIAKDTVENGPCYSIKKREICERANDLCYDDRMDIMRILMQKVKHVKIKDHSDGSRINIDNIGEGVINSIYYLIINKLKITNNNLI